MTSLIGAPTALWHAASGWWKAHPFTVDAFFAVLFFVVTTADLYFRSSDGTHRDADLFAYLLLAGQTLSIAARRRTPVAMMYVASVSFVLFWLLDYPLGFDTAAGVGIYSAAANGTDRRRTWVHIGAVLAVMSVLPLLPFTPREGTAAAPLALGVAVFHLAAALLGEIVYQRGRRIDDLEDRAQRAEEALETNARFAVIEERTRIAREMHDIVAHGMSVIAVQAAAAQSIAGTDPEKTVEVLARIENAGRESLTEMRRMLAVLRADEDQQASLAPQPSIQDIPHAVARSVESGVATELVITGLARPLAAGIELTAFRIVQEALTNVRRHAGNAASATVRLAYDPSTLTIDVTDDGRGAVSALSDAGGGNGLIGMRERIEIYDGTFEAGPVAGGGYAVRAVLPVDASESRPSVVSALPAVGEASQ